MLKPLLKKAIPLLVMIPLLGSCSLFQPQTKTIEYDEQVKLHNGEMIWVHITRHYKLVGGAIGDPGWRESTYMPSAVEISWDTGFPNVGRKSVFFKHAGSIDRLNDVWYLVGNPRSCNLKNNYLEKGISFGDNCIEHLGVWINESESKKGEGGTYMYVVDRNGNFIKNKGVENLPISVAYNLLSVNGFSEAQNLKDKKLTWQEKLAIRQERGYNPFITPVNPEFKSGDTK